MPTILHTESSMGWGGQEIRIILESLGMVERGYRIIIAAPEESIIFQRAKDAGIHTIPASFQKGNPAAMLRLRSLINRERPDIINTHSSSDSWMSTIAAQAFRRRPRIVRTRHLSTPISRSHLSQLIYVTLTDAIITTGEEIRQRMIKDNGFDASRIISIPTGVDLRRFNPGKVKPAFQSEGFSIGMVGVLRSWKGHRYFLESIPEISRQIPESLFYIAGDGPQHEDIKRLIQRLSLQDRVIMLSHREDIPEVLASLDVVVHPSYANEGVPQSILQAFAMEKPVVASDAGAIKEVVINGITGFLVKPRDPGELAERVIDLYKKPETRTKFGREGRRLVEDHYSLREMLNKIEFLYKRLL